MGVLRQVSELGGTKVTGGANFGAFDGHFVVHCTNVVRSIPSCFAVKVRAVGLYHRAKFGWRRLSQFRDMGV